MSPSALLPEDDVPRKKSPLDWLSTPDEEKGAVGETFTFSKKQKWVELDSVCTFVRTYWTYLHVWVLVCECQCQ